MGGGGTALTVHPEAPLLAKCGVNVSYTSVCPCADRATPSAAVVVGDAATFTSIF